MSQHVNRQSNLSELSELSELEQASSAMIAAQVFGYILTIFGWFIFGAGILTIFFDAYCSDGKPGAASCFSLASFFLVPGWLLLRFGAGLFPFSRQIFKEKRES